MTFKAEDGWVEKFKEKDAKKYYFVSPDGEKCLVDCYIGVRNAYVLTGAEAEAVRIPKCEFHKNFKKYDG